MFTTPEKDKRGGGDGGSNRSGHARGLALHLPTRKGRGSLRRMGIVELLALAGSISVLSGWRVYLCVLVTGLAMRFGWIAMPHHLHALDVLANPWVLAIAAVGFVAEFFVDKIAWIDTLWDAVHTAIRPVGGALLALAIVDAGDPAWQAASALLGGGAALMSHGAKASTRALVNVSPEPFSNIAVSGSEDVATGGLLALALASPVGALIALFVAAIGSLAILIWMRRLLGRLMPATD